MTCDVRCHVSAGPVGQPAGSAPLVIGDRDRVAQQTLGGGPDQLAQRLQLRRGRRCGGSHAHTVVPGTDSREPSMPFLFQVYLLSVVAHTMCSVTDRLVIRGAREHNLQNISLDLPRDALIVFTGLSGSGKSSLAFDTIFAEGQRRYVESLSAYARQFLGQMDKPDVDFIEGLSPAVSIDQKSTSRNPRSTVGTITEVYDYLRLLYARAGRPHCPICGEPISRQSPQQIVDRLMAMEDGHPLPGARSGGPRPQGEYVEVFPRAGRRRLQPRPGRRPGRAAHRPARPRQEVQALHRRDRRPARGEAERQAPADRLGGDRAEAGAGRRHPSISWISTRRIHNANAVYSEKMACPNNHDIGIDELEPRQFSFNGPWGACPPVPG